MSGTPPELPEELVSLEDLHLDLGSGRHASVRRYLTHLHECAEKPPIALDRAYSAKPLVLVEKQVVFPEIAILASFKKMGWDGAWVDTQHHKFFDRMPNQSKGMSLGAHASQAIARIAQYNENARTGCWDLVLWSARAIAFAAVVAGRPGVELGEIRIRWLRAAIKSGLSASQFVVVEWDYRKVAARKRHGG